jgi:hypothetical protein
MTNDALATGDRVMAIRVARLVYSGSRAAKRDTTGRKLPTATVTPAGTAALRLA